jgi:hypothetical protein
MDTAEYDYSDFQKQRQRDADKSLFVKFEYRPWHDKRESLVQGRPIYKDLIYVNIRGAGAKEGVCRPATQADIARFREHYDMFMRRTDDEQLVGTPLAEWPQMPRSRVEELAYLKVKTVEQLANMSDTNMQNFMGLHQLKQQAQEWLAKSSGADAKIAALEAQIAEMNVKMAAMMNPQVSQPETPKRRPGRPKVKGTTDASVADTHSE